MIRVAVIDDHPIARRGIEQMLASAGTCEVVASVATAAELAGPADVVIMDLYHDGDRPCLAAVAQVAAVSRVLVISASGHATDVVGAIEAGASGYVTKHAEAQMFVAAVETVAAGGFAMSSQLADILQAGFAFAPQATASGPQLSAREEETLALIAKGLTHAQVAKRMGVTKSTVDTYVERIRAKLQVGNKAELTRAALQRSGRPGDPA
jgi:DNA-binding NarL/FixJ family response regulator